MKKLLIFLFLGVQIHTFGQQLVLKKGIVLDSIPINDSIPESFSLYLPKSFDINKTSPIIFVFDMEGRSKRAMRAMQVAAEEERYILASSNNVNDSLSISKNVLITNRMFNSVFRLLPIAPNRSYTAGFSSGGKFASIVPTFIKNVRGVISFGGGIANEEVLSVKKPYHFISIVGKEDFNYTQSLAVEKLLNGLKFPNNFLVFDGGHQWPKLQYIQQAMQIFTLAAMTNGNASKDEKYIENAYQSSINEVNKLVSNEKLLEANGLLGEVISIFRLHKNIDTLKTWKRTLTKEKLFRASRRNENAALLKESFTKEDYLFSLEEDINTYNYNNLGWWSYQMDQLKMLEIKANVAERQLGKRLKGYINALIEDNIDLLLSEAKMDEDAILFLWMLKTITAPKAYEYYKEVISLSALREDSGTALFYLEEMLKNGYTDKEKIYAIENTGLLRITPEFNAIVAKYLKDARYDIIQE